jgi:hypothetical protein
MIMDRRSIICLSAVLLTGCNGSSEEEEETAEVTINVIAGRAEQVPDDATVVDCDDERIRRSETVAGTLDDAAEDGESAVRTVTVDEGAR